LFSIARRKVVNVPMRYLMAERPGGFAGVPGPLVAIVLEEQQAVAGPESGELKGLDEFMYHLVSPGR
jgi:hypothetical protein